MEGGAFKILTKDFQKLNLLTVLCVVWNNILKKHDFSF